MYPIQGLVFLKEHRLWAMAGASIFINVLLLALLVGGGFYYVTPLMDSAHTTMLAYIGDSATAGFLIDALMWMLWIVVAPALIFLNFILLVLVGQAVASPFLDSLSEQVETRALGTQPAPFGLSRTVKSVLVALGDLIWGLAFLVMLHVPLLFLAFIPFFGTVLASVISFAFSALLLTHEFMGLPLIRQLVGYRRRWSYVWRNKWLALGMGTATMALLAVPGLNLVLLPLATAGGTLLYCDLRAEGRV